ncbi:MAG: hypothetical protein N4A71_15015 [Carboxylicivirga sp.]|jgi:hypothetical protein|nr:hypothetical protein [Carboxylicivirga sp.]
MKTISTFLLLTLTITSFAQHIDGPANMRKAPNGDKLFSLNDYVWVSLKTEQPVNNWYELEVYCYVVPNDLINKTTVKANTTLLSVDGDSIGFTYNQFEIENYSERYYAYDDLEQIEISLKGHTYKSNIRKGISNGELLANKKSLADSCMSTYVSYQEENGQWVDLIEECSIYPASIMINNERESVLVKQKQKIKRYAGAEGQYSVIDLEFKKMNYSDNPTIKEFTIEADKVDIEYPLLNAVTYGCCGAENYYQLFTTSNFEKLMDYIEVLYEIDIPNSSTKGYLGYIPFGRSNDEEIVGQLTFIDGKEVRNTVYFATKDKSKQENILQFVPDMEFKPISDRDKIRNEGLQIRLWSQNANKGSSALTGFKFLIHLIDDSTGKDYVQELEITDGYVNGNSEKEFTIWID